ncbi:MAG: NblA/ycf18 family protein [Stanieria sp.]|uniref:Phycobilisome degradation protein nblA n=1 Tax=Stanieria cyanosphaera (strain ATCC 29371 / PCC 7437) TaxID=111780 RepID=K9XPG1_STAC7|nr:NblA/ycf18 family protein [Stanieria cyanosphaera]AFZ34418.1 Phycobilisome degradation protein nblA [Stanieria cyanosphaera PCC 7437]BAU63156.1 phycobilisome degradation protein [Stanieria sp. NIES-3757]
MDANPAGINFNNLNLTLEQKLQMRLFQDSAENMNREQALSLLLEASRLLMIKDNIIRDLIKQNLSF